MRWLFLIVFSLNLIYVAWQTNLPSEKLYADVPALKDVQSIVLLSEAEQAQKERVSSGDAVTELPDDKSRALAAAKKPSPASGESIKLPVNIKQPKAKAVAETGEVGVITPVPLPATKAESCFTLGPFRDLEKLRSLTREIKSYVLEADFRGREEKQQSLYWVYIKPEKNRAMAVETGRRLKASKIKDFYVIRSGEKKHGLSLGRFRNKKGAYGLAEKVRKLGFEVLVEPIFKTYTVYWLDYRLAGGVSIPESIFEKHIQSAKKDKISRLSRECSG